MVTLSIPLLATTALAAAAAASAASPATTRSGGYQLKAQGNYSIGHAAMSSLPCLDYVANTGAESCPREMHGLLLVTSFGEFGNPGIFSVDVVSGGSPKLVSGESSTITWPNVLTPLPTGTVPGLSDAAFILGDGFLSPLHTDGGIYIFDLTSQKLQRISEEDPGWFYHVGFPYDVNKDGRIDVVAARAKSPPKLPWAKKEAELVWFRQPSTAALNSTWNMTTLLQNPGSPDFLFTATGEKRNASGIVIAAAEFYSQKVAIFSEKNPDSPSLDLVENVVDNSDGPMFGCVWADVNGDGQSDLLATSHKNRNGALYAYEWEKGANPTTEKPLKKHVLASGFSAKSPLPGMAAPGGAVPVYPRGKQMKPGERPYIMLSGDNENDAFVLIPTEGDPWGFTKQSLGNFGGDIGGISAGDVDGDGFADVFIPLYDAGSVLHLEFAPAAAA